MAHIYTETMNATQENVGDEVVSMQVNHDLGVIRKDNEWTVSDPTKITGIQVSSKCARSYPCQHACKILYGNGSEECKVLSAKVIAAEFWGHLSHGSRIHFGRWKRA